MINNKEMVGLEIFNISYHHNIYSVPFAAGDLILRLTDVLGCETSREILSSDIRTTKMS